MKKILSLLAILMTMATAAVAQTTVEKSFVNYSPTFSSTSFTYNLDDNITLKIKSDQEVKSINNNLGIVFYGNSDESMTISAKEGYTITNIEYSFSNASYSPSAAANSFDATNSTQGITNTDATSTFTGSANSVVMKFGKTYAYLSLTNLKVTYTAPAPTPTAQTTGTAKATINGTEVEIGWVQLWKDGPRFATRNVGATGTSDKESTRGTMMTFTDATKTGSDYVWGANWKTPSKDEMDLLNTSKVTYSYVQQDGVWGFKFTGKQDGYTSNSIFLPVRSTDSSYAEDYYWTSSMYNEKEAWFLDLNCEEGDYYCDFYTDDLISGEDLARDFVRPVLVDAPAATEVTLSENDDITAMCEWDESKTYDITLSRTIKADRWNTLMLSFPMTAAEVKSNFGSDVTLMKMTGIADNVVNFETVDLATDANTAIEVCEAYIVKPTAAIEQIKVTGKTGLKNDIYEGDYKLSVKDGYSRRVFGDWTVRSSFYSSIVKSTSIYDEYVLSNDKFYYADEEKDILGYRWLLYTKKAQAKAGLSISFDGDVATAISNVDADVDANKAQAQGKFLQNGKLVIKKDGKQFNAAGQQIR